MPCKYIISNSVINRTNHTFTTKLYPLHVDYDINSTLCQGYPLAGEVG